MKAACHHKHPQRSEHFLSIAILVLLNESKDHGYNLLNRLERFGFSKESLNVGTLYRALRRMEKNGYVQSEWDKEASKKPRRVYTINASGRAHLEEWIERMRIRREWIHELIRHYENT